MLGGEMKKRLIYPLAFAAVAMSLCSCATQDMIAKANGTPGPLDPPDQPPQKPNPAYYLLVPVVFPFDLVAWPFEYLYLQSRSQPEPSGPPPAYYQPSPGMTPYRPVNQPPPKYQY